MHNTLFKNKWIELRERDGYVYSHEASCEGLKIAVLPYRISEGKAQFLLRQEVTVCWNDYNQVVSSITGGYEGSTEGTAVMEIYEEAGYRVVESDLISLGTCYGVKSTDTVYFLFGVNLTGMVQSSEAGGDGSEFEKLAHCTWMESIDDAKDPMVYVMHHRLMEVLR